MPTTHQDCPEAADYNPFEHVPVALYRTTLEGRILAANPALERLLGYPAETLLTMNAADLYEDPAGRERMLALLERDGSVQLFEIRLRRADGAVIWVRDTGRAIHDADGKLVFYEGVLEDITERKRAAEALRASEARYRELFENAHDIIYTTNLQGDVTSLNKAAEQLTGYTREQALGKSFRYIVAPEHHELVQEMIRRKLGGEPHTTFEVEILTKDGSRRFLEVSSRLIFSDGRPTGVQAIARDITERKQADAELARQARELARSNAELEQFAWIVSHDLQEPLRMVHSFAELLAERYQGKLDADEFIGYMVDGAERMQALIRALLEYSRVSTRGRAFSATDLGAVLERVLHDLGVPLREAGATVTHDPLPTVMCDGLQMGQLLQNLISNGVKFRGTQPPRIHVAAARQAGEWIFSVRDNGVGIDPAEFEHIFRLFERGRTQRQHPGTGIGLAIAKRIAERHGGRIWVESKPGEGSMFYFTLSTG